MKPSQVVPQDKWDQFIEAMYTLNITHLHKEWLKENLAPQYFILVSSLKFEVDKWTISIDLIRRSNSTNDYPKLRKYKVKIRIDYEKHIVSLHVRLARLDHSHEMDEAIERIFQSYITNAIHN